MGICSYEIIFLVVCFFTQGVVYQLDVALESVDTQRSGLVFIYDMSDSKYANFDYDLSQKILTLLKVIICIFFIFRAGDPIIGGIQYHSVVFCGCSTNYVSRELRVFACLL